MKIVITEEQKKKLFIPRGLSDDSDNRYLKLNKEQSIKTVNGKEIQINQYDYNGKKQGYWEEYYSNGKLLRKGEYVNDKMEGIWAYYYRNGELSSKVEYKNDRLLGRLPLTEGKIYSYQLNPSYSDPDKREIVYEFINKDGYDFEVSFYNLGDNNWEREYRTKNKGYGVINTGDVYNIIETVTKITLNFIEKYKPNNIYIEHISNRRDILKHDIIDDKVVTKRALLNKKYLKPVIDKLDDYYYNLIGSKSIISKI